VKSADFRLDPVVQNVYKMNLSSLGFLLFLLVLLIPACIGEHTSFTGSLATSDELDNTVSSHPAVAAHRVTSPVVPSNDLDLEGDRRKEVKYLVGILKHSRPLQSHSDVERIVEMTSKSGHKYRCVIPSASSPAIAAKDDPISRNAAVVKKLRAAYSKGCFTRSKDYWTYEVCPFQKVRQYHKEGSAATMEFDLGRYNAGADDFRKDGSLVQSYTGGAGGRQSRVRFVCPTGSASSGDDKALLTSIQEPQPHVYEFEIRTDIVCHLLNRPLHLDDSADTFTELLAPLNNQCVRMNTGWWTYEYCYNNMAKQFHVEARSRAKVDDPTPNDAQHVVTAEYMLGVYRPQGKPLSSFRLVESDMPAQTYIAQWYLHGTPCDIGSRQDRKTEVRFYCDQNADMMTINNIVESATCEYQLHVGTQLLCRHPKFVDIQPAVREIECSPVAPASNALMPSS